MGMQSLIQAFGPPNLPQAIDMLTRDFATARASLQNIERILGAQAEAQQEPGADVMTFSIGSAGPDTYYGNSDRLVLIGGVLTSDTLGRYGLTLGNDTSRWWRLNSNIGMDLGFTIERYIVLPRGVSITFSVPANANWDCIFWARADRSVGKVAP